MKMLVALPLIVASGAVFAGVDQCEGDLSHTVPAAGKRAAARTKPKVPAAPVVGPKLHLTPYIPVRPFARPSRVKMGAALKFDCLLPVSMPPGAIRVGYSIPYVGVRPEWGNPTPSYLATGPMSIRPGSPDDFYPAAYAPPAAVPPGTTDVPEPPTIALMLLGVILLLKKSRTRR